MDFIRHRRYQVKLSSRFLVVNNFRVWINNGLGLNPPSLNVATLNGLDSADNSPYSNQSIATGLRDTLVSQPIKLNEVISAERNSVYLSFFISGLGTANRLTQMTTYE